MSRVLVASRWLAVLICGAQCASAGGTGGSPSAVPPPFSPVVVERSNAGVVDVRVWGRRYRFAAGPLPQEIESQGRPLLERIPRFVVGGRELRWTAPEILASGPRSVRLACRGVGPGGLLLAATTEVEYDGMIRVEVSTRAGETAASIDGYAYEFAVPREAAQFFNHHLLYDFHRESVDKQSLLEAAGKLSEGRRRLDFTPTLFLGGRRIGIEWWSETNAHFAGPRAVRPIELFVGPESARVRVEPISGRLDLAPGEAWSDTFALFPAPMRPAPPEHRSLRLVSQGLGMPHFATDIDTRFLWIAMSLSHPPRWHGLPHSRRDERQRRLRTQLARRDIGFIPYGKLTAAPNLHPRTMANKDAWSTDGRWWRRPNAPEIAVFEANGDAWRPGQPYSYPVCMNRSDYLDWLLEENLRALREERLDGLYFDLGGILRMCRRNPVLQGKRGREVWEYFNVRSFYKRLYERMREVAPDARLVIHSHGTPRALGAFVDVYLLGESLNGPFTRTKRHRDARKDPRLYEPDYLALADGWLPAMFHPRVGGATVLLPQIKWAAVPGDSARVSGYQRAMYAWALAEDVPTMFANLHFETAEPILRALDRFGSMQGVSVDPWWETPEAVSAGGALRVTLYRKPKRTLAVVANWSERPIEATLRVDGAALGLGPEPSIRDAEAPDQPPHTGPLLPIRVPARDFRMLLLERHLEPPEVL